MATAAMAVIASPPSRAASGDGNSVINTVTASEMNFGVARVGVVLAAGGV